jgi:hypothetical protein
MTDSRKTNPPAAARSYLGFFYYEAGKGLRTEDAEDFSSFMISATVRASSSDEAVQMFGTFFKDRYRNDARLKDWLLSGSTISLQKLVDITENPDGVAVVEWWAAGEIAVADKKLVMRLLFPSDHCSDVCRNDENPTCIRNWEGVTVRFEPVAVLPDLR